MFAIGMSRALRRCMRSCVVMLACVAALRGDARADTSDASYLYDGGAIPLFWIPLAGRFIVDNAISPRATPLLFDAHAGGAEPASWEVPVWTVGLAGAGVASLIGLAGHDWDHAKGLAEALATSSFLVSIAKPIFGRHRPDWTPATSDPNESESFPSGHAADAFVIATYSALYLNGHVWAGEPMTPTHALAYAGIFTGALLVDAERVYHDRHFISDVVAGSLLGAATSALIYRYQDARASAAPSVETHAPTFSFMGTF
jgi:membrane-associated phospholipid phosphatase